MKFQAESDLTNTDISDLGEWQVQDGRGAGHGVWRAERGQVDHHQLARRFGTQGRWECSGKESDGLNVPVVVKR